jgi:hypothetical protein
MVASALHSRSTRRGHWYALVLALVAVSLVGARVGAAATVPYEVVAAVHGRVVGWAKTGSDWFAV